MQTIFVSLFLFSHLFAGQFVIDGKQSLVNRSYYLKSNIQQPDEVIELWFNSRDQFHKLERFNIGYTDHLIWVVVPEIEPAILELANPHIDRVSLYSFDQASHKLIGHNTGDDYPFDSRAIDYRNFAWPIDANYSKRYLLLRIEKKNSSLSLPLFLWEPTEFYKNEQLVNLFYGICFGMMILIAIYSILAGLFLNEKIFYFYFLFIISSMLFLTTNEGLSFQFLYPSHGGANGFFRIAVLIFVSASLAFFSLEFLRLRQWLPRVVTFLQGTYVFLGALLLLIPWLGSWFLQHSYFFVPLALVLSVAGSITCLVSAFLTSRHQKSTSMVYVAAYMAIVISGIIMMLEDYGWIERLPVTVMFGGVMVEMIVFSIALTYRMKHVYDERNLLSVRISQHQKELMKSYLDGIEKERERISRELHDDIGSRLSMLRKSLEDGMDKRMAETIKKIGEDVRSLSHQLAPPTLVQTDFGAMIDSFAHEVYESTKILVRVQQYDFPALRDDQRVELFRIVQEAVQNVVKHSQATEIDIQLLGHEDQWVVTIEDNGRGFNSNTSGRGLAIMKLRVRNMEAELDINSSPEKGTIVMITRKR